MKTSMGIAAALFEKSWFKKAFLAISLFSLMICMTLAGRNLQSHLDWPKGLISQVEVVEAGGVLAPQEVSALNYFWLERASRKVKALQPFFATIGDLRHPIALEIDTVNSLRYDVSENRIAIGLEVLKASGQLERSILKTWILQNTRTRLMTSALRQEVTADLLYSFFNGSLDLEDPVLHKAVNFLKVNNEWTDLLLPLDRFCKTAWRPLELLTICQTLRGDIGSSLISTPMMARPLIGSLVWAKYTELRWRERESFVRAFTETIQTQNPLAPLANDPLLPRIPSEWRLFIEHEARSLSPVNETLPHLPQNEALVVRKSPKGWALLPGEMPIPALRIPELKLKRLVWESCEQPKIRELLASSGSATRILFVQNCDAQSWDYEAYRNGQTQAFAMANPNAKFIAFHRDSLLLAEKKGLIDQIDLISWVLQTPRLDFQVADAYLGISNAIWRKDIQAFRTTGSLEAVEMFRQ